MKKIILLILITLSFLIQLNAQEIADNTLGLRFGDDDGLGAEITYQKFLYNNNRAEIGFAWRNNKNYNAFKLTGTHQWLFNFDQLINGMNWYVGAGGGFGSWKLKDDLPGDDGTFLFIAGDIGVEYKFDFPLLLSLDFRPELGFSDFNDDLGVDIALGARYVF